MALEHRHAPTDGSGGGNGTCGRMHGELSARMAGCYEAIHDLAADQDRQWAAIADRLRWRVFCWIAGAVMALAMAGAGTFAIAQRAAIDTHREHLQRVEGKCSQVEERWDQVRDQLTGIAVSIERLETTMRHHQEDHAREGRQRAPGR